MYTKIKAVLLIAFTSFYSNYVFAGTGNGTVSIAHVGQWSGIDIVFFFTTNHDSLPSCNTYQKRWALNVSTELGKAQYSLLLAAQMSGKSVEVRGRNNCDIHPDSESVHWVGFPVN